MNKIILSSVVIALLSFSGCNDNNTTTTTPVKKSVVDISFGEDPLISRVGGQVLSVPWEKASGDIEYFVSGGADRDIFVVTNTETRSVLNFIDGKEPVYVANGDNVYVVEIRGKDTIENRLGSAGIFTVTITAPVITNPADVRAPIITTALSFSMPAGSSTTIEADEVVTFDAFAKGGFVLKENGKLTAPDTLNIYTVPVVARDAANNGVRKDFNITVTLAQVVVDPVEVTPPSAENTMVIGDLNWTRIQDSRLDYNASAKVCSDYGWRLPSLTDVAALTTDMNSSTLFSIMDTDTAQNSMIWTLTEATADAGVERSMTYWFNFKETNGDVTPKYIGTAQAKGDSFFFTCVKER